MRRTNRLSPKEAVLFDALVERTGKDVSMDELHRKLYGEGDNPRVAQQRLGAVISRINVKKYKTHKIVPGELKRTYRIVLIEQK